MAKLIGVLALIIGVVGIMGGLIVYNTFVWGFICYKFYYWFILPVFTQVPLITLSQAIGFIFFISLFKNNYYDNIKKEFKDEWWKPILSMMLTPWALFVLAYFFK